MSLDAIKAMRAKLKAEKKEVAEESGKKYITKAELEAAKLKRIRVEEEQERQAKARHPCVHAILHTVNPMHERGDESLCSSFSSVHKATSPHPCSFVSHAS